MQNVLKSKILIGAILAAVSVTAAVIIAVNAGHSGNDLQIQLDLGNKYVSELDYENAIIAYEEALEIDPYCLEAYLGLADAYMALGQQDKAIEIMEKAKEMLPQELEVYTQLAEFYLANGNTESYIKILKEGYENTGSETLLAMLEGYETPQGETGSHAEDAKAPEDGDKVPEQKPEAEPEAEVAKGVVPLVVKPAVPVQAEEVIPLVAPIGTSEENGSGDSGNANENDASDAGNDSDNNTDNGGTEETPDDNTGNDEEVITTGISGAVRGTNDNVPLPDINVTLKPAGNEESSQVKTAVTDADGNYSLSLEPGEYVAVFSGADFEELYKEGIQIVKGEVFYYNPVLLTTEQGKEKTTVKISIMDAVTASPVGDVAVNFYEGFVNSDKLGNSVATGKTDANGKALIKVPHAGYYTVSMQKDGYVSIYHFLTVFGKEYITPAALSPLLKSENQYRIVMSWGAKPSILDSHFFGEDSDGTPYHICWFRWRNLSQTVTLDIDHMGGYGPETITANIDITKEQRYIVHNYSGGGDMVLSESGAKVQVYGKEGLVYEASVPNMPGRTWHVFNIKNGVIEPVNYIDFSSEKIYPGDGYGPQERAPYTYDNTNVYGTKMIQLDEYGREITGNGEFFEDGLETDLMEGEDGEAKLAGAEETTAEIGTDGKTGFMPDGSTGVSGNVATAAGTKGNP